MFTGFTSFWWLSLFLLALLWLGHRFVSFEKKQMKLPLWRNNVNAETSDRIITIKTSSLLIGLLLLLIAVWQPQWGIESDSIKRKGLDIVFTVDVSKSMQALDLSNSRQTISRLDAAKHIVQEFIQKRKNDRIGLVEFAGESFVASPLTLDNSVFSGFLQNISSDDLGKQGTNLAEALEISIARLEVQSIEDRGKAIILFSDGDETIDSQTKIFANQAKKKGIKIFTVGIGSEKGVPIPEGQDAFGRVVYKQWKGQTVLTALNPEPLKQLARISGGAYEHADSISDILSLQKTLDALPTKVLSEDFVSPRSERYFLFALLGLVFFVFGLVYPQYPIFKK